MKVKRFPKDPGAAAWNAILPPPDPATPLDADISADFLIIGAGFTGLAAARRLGQIHPDAQIVVLDALRGEGIEIAEEVFASLVDAAGFSAMKDRADDLAPGADVHALAARWQGWWAATGRPRLSDPQAAFLGWVRSQGAGGSKGDL